MGEGNLVDDGVREGEGEGRKNWVIGVWESCWERDSEDRGVGAVREIADSSCRSHLRSVMAPSCLLHASRARERCWEPLAAMACEG